MSGKHREGQGMQTGQREVQSTAPAPREHKVSAPCRESPNQSNREGRGAHKHPAVGSVLIWSAWETQTTLFQAKRECLVTS